MKAAIQKKALSDQVTELSVTTRLYTQKECSLYAIFYPISAAVPYHNKQGLSSAFVIRLQTLLVTSELEILAL